MHNTAKLILFAFFCILGITTITSCDQIDYRTAQELPGPIDPNDTTAPKDSSVILTKRVLLFDFTGHTCGNCPTGHDEAKNLQAYYPGKIIVIGIHCSFFAEPLNRPDSVYAADYRTPAGNELDTYYEAGNAGLPRGVFNGIKSTISTPTAWSSKIVAELAKPALVGMSATISGGNLKIRVTQPEASTRPLLLTVYTLRDSITSWQKDYRRSGSAQNIPNYVHKHVLRARPVQVPNFVSTGFKGNKQATYAITFSDNSKPWRNHAVATLSDASSGEVFQVAEAVASPL